MHLKKGLNSFSFFNVDGNEGMPFFKRFLTSFSLSVIFLLSGSANLANAKLDRVYS